VRDDDQCAPSTIALLNVSLGCTSELVSVPTNTTSSILTLLRRSKTSAEQCGMRQLPDWLRKEEEKVS
jgi:hypothetical protein